MKILLTILFLSFFLTSFFYEKPENVACVTNEISMVEKQYNALPPDTGKKKKEIIIENSGFNINDSIQRAEFRENIDSTLINSYTHTKVINNAISYGVLKSSGCGGYPELDVFMDCEEHNPETSSFGWTGASYVDDKKNVMLKFCVVDASAYFHKINVDYAVLGLGEYIPSGAVSETIVITNEVGDQYSSGDNSNYIYYNGIFINETNYPIGKCKFNHHNTYDYHNSYCNVKFYYTTDLNFYYFKKDPYYDEMGITDFPNLTTLGGRNYGVFGRFGNNQGYIYSDDEDDSGDNGMSCIAHKKNFNSGNIPNIVVIGNGNTRLYFSNVKSCY